MTTLRRWWRYIVLLFWRDPPAPQAKELSPAPPAPQPIPVPQPGPAPRPEPPAPPPPAPPAHLNRRARRGWEVERRKRDKFVTPKGPEPVSVPRGPRKAEAKPLAPQSVGGDGNICIVGDDGAVYEESELWGVFNFRDTILDQLERYWIYLRRMQKHDPDAYGFYKEVGATVVPLLAWLLQDGAGFSDKPRKPEKPKSLSPWWRTHRPSFGCVSYGLSSRIEAQELIERTDGQRYWVPKFLYFTKYKQPPPEVQPTSGGDVYAMTIWWDKPQDTSLAKKMKGGSPEQYAVYISRDGNDVHVLPTLNTKMVTIPDSKNGLANFRIPQRAWRINPVHAIWAKQNNSDLSIFLSNIFIDAAVTVEHAQYSVVRVAVHNGDLTAVFGVEVKRLPYFFQDRDIELTERGVKKRIFHYVRPHVRKDGTKVPSSFRGLREFEWAGYRVSITVPGRDHFMLTDFEGGVSDTYWIDDSTGMVSTPEFGKQLAEAIERGER